MISQKEMEKNIENLEAPGILPSMRSFSIMNLASIRRMLWSMRKLIMP